jgi:putative ABC transport system substrate-binding protein
VNRRDLLVFLGCTAAAWPLAARAQQKAMPVIGFLGLGDPGNLGNLYRVLAPWRTALSEAGFVEGRNLLVEYRLAASVDGFPALAAELVNHRVDVIMTTSGVAARAAKAATDTIPIVFASAVDPVGFGLANSLQRPGGNVTGVASTFDAMETKRLQMLHELAPAATRVGYLVNPQNPNPALQQERLIAASQELGVEVITLTSGRFEDLGAALATGTRSGIGALLVSDDPAFGPQARQLVDLVAPLSLPAMYVGRGFVTAGGLASYSAPFEDRVYQAGVYVGRILKGEKPANIPITQPTKFELVINLKTAKTLGLTVPQSLLARADEVIE